MISIYAFSRENPIPRCCEVDCQILAIPFATICHYSPLFATVLHYSHYSRLFALFVLFAIRYSLFGIIRCSLFATIRYSLFGFSRYPLDITNILVVSPQIRYIEVFDKTNPPFSEQIWPVPSDFVKSRFTVLCTLYCTINSYPA